MSNNVSNFTTSKKKIKDKHKKNCLSKSIKVIYTMGDNNSLIKYTFKNFYMRLQNIYNKNNIPSSQEQTLSSTQMFSDLSNSLYMNYTSSKCLKVFSHPLRYL